MITTTIEEWEKEYTSDEEWNTHRAKTITDWTKKTNTTTRKYVAEIKWNRKGELIKQYMITLYEYIYDDDFIRFEIIERKQYKSRKAMMNKMRKIEKEVEEKLRQN